jgi:hypothetical protein
MKSFIGLFSILAVSSCSSAPMTTPSSAKAMSAEITPAMWVARLGWDDRDARTEAWRKLRSMGPQVLPLLETAAAPSADGTEKALLQREAISLLIELNPAAYVTEQYLGAIVLDESQPLRVRKLAALTYKRSFPTEFSTTGPRFLKEIYARPPIPHAPFARQEFFLWLKSVVEKEITGFEFEIEAERRERLSD